MAPARKITLYTRRAPKRTKYWPRKKYKNKWRNIPLTIAPRSKMCRLRYCEVISLNPGTLTFDTAQFALNNLHDPNTSTLSNFQHQPRGYDEAMLLYKRWVVVGAKITMRPIGPDIGTELDKFSTCYGLYLHPDGETGFPCTSYIDLVETRIKATYSYTGLDNSKSRTLSMKVSMKKHFNVEDIGDDFVYSGSLGTNVGKKCLVTAFAVNPSGENSPGCTYKLMIEYVVVFQDAKFLQTS